MIVKQMEVFFFLIFIFNFKNWAEQVLPAWIVIALFAFLFC